LDKVAHLRLAAEHLEAAGKSDLAKQVAREALLEKKLEQLHKLQEEVRQLRGTTAADQTVTMHVKIMELQVSKLRKLGLDLPYIDGVSPEQITGGAPIKLTAVNELISALRQHQLVKVLAEPTLVTVSGRPATFQSGGEFPIIVPQGEDDTTVEYRQFGTRLDCVANVLDNGRLRLELRPTVSEIDTSRSVMIQDKSVPGLRTRMVDTAIEMESGETFILSGMAQRRAGGEGESDESEETALLVTVTASLGEPTLQAENKTPSFRY
jgi:Flp pilus assembly secretin CpaC